ncbi:class D sortase [Fictibacillus phosphorivorans]|uniref:class D sortase n=1 Tax=Fictibacillus phosphorivorans TaxID=1221500 RepID=UPI0012930505|nr:class D sortase [Fictibacillus phosphorivorans]MQR94794.1 class D sortase [Fictibacillus phosphorivorans]
MRKKWILLILSVALISGGVWFSSTSIYQLTKGYLMFKFGPEKTFTENNEKVQATENTKKSEKTEKLLYEVRPKIGEQMGELRIPKLDAVLPIYHGTNEDELEKGVGHFADSVLPGEKDNSVLSGHRDTVFRKLGEVGKGDLLVVETTAGTFTYKVRKVRIVDKDDRSVIVSMPRATLTVSTCYPFTFVGAAPDRYVLVAYLIKSDKK